MAKIRKIYDEAIKPDGSKQVIYPITSTRAVYTPTNITVDTLLNEGYRFGGVVLPTDSPTFTDQRVFYGASVPGVYSNFGGISVDGGEAIFLMYNGTEWKKGIFGGAGSNNLTGFKSLASISELPLEETTIGYLIEDSTLPEGFSKQVLYVWVGENGDTLDGLYQNCGQLRGASAYESAVRNGYEGTVEEWLNDPVNGIKGNGIKSWTVDQSTADSGESTITVEFDKTPTETFKVKNGRGISSITETPSVANGGTNVIHINLSDGTSYDIDVKNGSASDGFYATATLLNTAIPSPNVGDYAFVSKAGDGTFPAYIYVCTTAGTWTNSEQEFTTEVAQVSVSQNTETGHTDINIGSDSYPVASVEEVSQLGQEIGENVFEIAKIGDLEQVTGTGAALSPTETLSGYYNVDTKQWVANGSFTFKVFNITANKYYDIYNRTQGGSNIASLVLFKDSTPIHIARYTYGAHFYVKAVNFDQIGLSAAESSLTQYDSIKMPIPSGAVETASVANGAITSEKIADLSVGASKIANGAIGNSKLEENAVTIQKISFKDLVYGTNRLDPNAVSDGYIDVNTGAFVENASRLATDYIPVSINGLYCAPISWYGVVGKAAVYNVNKQFLRGLESAAYTYQEGDAFVRWTINDEQLSSAYVIEGTQPGSYVPYTPPQYVIKQENIPEISTSKIADGAVTQQKLAPGISFPSATPAISLCGKDAAKVTAASISASGNLQITTFPQYLKANGIVSFFGKLSAFDEIFVGFGIGGTNSIQAKIDATNISIYKEGASLTGFVFAHGLTISDFINVTFDNDLSHPKIVVATKSGIFVQEMNEFPSLESYGYPAVVLGSGTTITDAELRATSDKFNKPIWVVGDSYMSLYEARWTYQMIKTIGIDNFLILGLAGGGSSVMYSDLQRALNFGTPKFLLWCLGMNDTYSTWKETYDNLVPLCAANGIELVLQTIPIPDLSSSSQQVAIDDFVRSSGNKYVDAAAAMSPNSSYPWYDGYETDGVHPTVLGARVLAGRFLSDFPEFMQYNP